MREFLIGFLFCCLAGLIGAATEGYRPVHKVYGWLLAFLLIAIVRVCL